MLSHLRISLAIALIVTMFTKADVKAIQNDVDALQATFNVVAPKALPKTTREIQQQDVNDWQGYVERTLKPWTDNFVKKECTSAITGGKDKISTDNQKLFVNFLTKLRTASAELNQQIATFRRITSAARTPNDLKESIAIYKGFAKKFTPGALDKAYHTDCKEVRIVKKFFAAMANRAVEALEYIQSLYNENMATEEQERAARKK